MLRIPFDDDWNVGPLVDAFDISMGAGGTTAVRLPHDLLQQQDRVPAGDFKRAFFPSGVGEYTKRFDVPDDYAGKRVSFEFGGVYRDALVYINGDFAAQRPNGYARFVVEADAFLKYGQENQIRVVARTHDDSRWYPGLGIYRDVRMLVGDLVHIEPHSLRVATPDVDDERAIVATSVSVANASPRTQTVTVTTRILGPGGDAVLDTSVPVTVRPGAAEVLRQRLAVPAALRWDLDQPNLYTLESSLLSTDDQPVTLDEDATTFGVRTLQLDVTHGLRINGTTVKLRGACIHHDNGVIGSAAIRRAEERQIELLKAAGFNAVRSAHNPLSTAQLDACDRLGVLVLDEAFDVWTDSKTSHDYALSFPEWHERDLESMVAKDFNHPSVVIYSIGNEVNETRTALGAGWSRRLAEHIRSLDPTRFVTNSVNLFVSAVPALAAMMPPPDPSRPAGAAAVAASGFETMGHMLNQVARSPVVTSGTAEAFATVDIAGFNYGDSRYEADRTLFPHRVILGTETFPDSIAANWQLVLENDHVIGDFTWTGWDYLGEAGLGRPRYRGEGDPMATPEWPWLLAWSGDIDITGHRRPASYYREIVFGLRAEPYIAVRRPDRPAGGQIAGLWTWSDSISSWTWVAEPGSPITVEVYSPDPEVELTINGAPVGTRPAGAAHDFRAVFETTWQQGEIVATGIAADGTRTATRLVSAKPEVALVARVDRETVPDDDGALAHIEVTVEDDAGTLATHADRVVTAQVFGPGVLQGFGSADPRTEETYTTDATTTFDGRALAVVRPTGTGTITVTFRSGDDEAIVTVEVHAAV